MISGGALAAACGIAVSGALNVAADYQAGNIKSWGDAAGSFVTGAAVGAVTMSIGAAGGALARGLGTFARVTVGTVAGAATSAVSEYLTTGQVSLGGVVLGAALGGLGSKLVGGRGRGCSGHSFDPSTRVLTSGGAAVAIADIKVGDKVVATDPVTGQTTDQPVTALHSNLDNDLVNITISQTPPASVEAAGEGTGDRSASGPVAILQTTEHHPFWDATTNQWTDAGNLKAGESTLLSPDRQVLYVTDVKGVGGFKLMRDLTIANTHTYYVLARETPVLVHNCGDNPPPFKNREPQLLADELATAKQAGVGPVGVGQPGFDELINSGTVKWAMGLDGTIRVIPRRAGGEQISHAVLFEGADVLAAGEARIGGSSGNYSGQWISNYSGHYRPCICSLDNAKAAFRAAGIHFS